MTVSGGTAVCGFGRQTAEGSALSAPKFEHAMGGGGIQPQRNVEELPWTNESRDSVGHFVSLVSGAFGMDVPVLPVSSAGWLQLALGTLTSGAGPPHSHAATGADVLPWATLFFGVGGEYLTLADAKVDTLVISGREGQPLNMRVEGAGKTVTRTQPAAKWSAATLDEAVDPFFRFINAEITIDVASTPASTVVHNLSNFELRIENNILQKQTDGIGFSFMAEGNRVIRLSSTDVLLEDWDYMKSIYFGSTTGTTLSTQPLYGSMGLTFTGSDEVAAATRSIDFALPKLHWEGTEWPGADPSRAPVTYAIGGVAAKPTSGEIITATVINGSAGATY